MQELQTSQLRPDLRDDIEIGSTATQVRDFSKSQKKVVIGLIGVR